MQYAKFALQIERNFNFNLFYYILLPVDKVQQDHRDNDGNDGCSLFPFNGIHLIIHLEKMWV